MTNATDTAAKPRRLTFTLGESEHRYLLEGMARRSVAEGRHVSEAEIVREALREKAQREGVAA